MNVGDTVHYTDSPNVRGTIWDCTGEVKVIRLPTKRDPYFRVRRMYSRPGMTGWLIQTTADRLKPLPPK